MSGSRAHGRRLIRACGAALVWLSLAAWPLFAQDEDAMSVADFVRQQPKWQVLKETTLKVEGRWRILNDDRLLFTNCDLLFVMGDGVRVPTSRGKSVQVTGALESRQGKLTFVVSRLKELPSDAEILADRRGRLPADDASNWYTLAAWAEQRGRFYEDADLLANATDLRRSGIMIEYRKVGVADIPGLYALAAKAEKLGLPPELRDEILHDALRRELRALRPRDTKQRDVVLTHLLNRLPKSDVQLPTEGDVLTNAVLELERQYKEKPLEVYEQADQEQRYLLHRLIYAHAMMERIELDAAADGSNGYKIAKRIEESVPEFKSKADEYREREVASQRKRVADLPRDELLVLVSRLEERNENALASEVKREWLTAQEPGFRGRGPGGLLDFAQEYISLLNDADAAAVIYMELFKDRAGQETARGRLVELGYQFDGSAWTKAAEGAPDDTANAIQRGIVRKGMTGDQVRAAFGGRPASIVKFAVRGQVSELWVYPEHGVAVEVARRGTDGSSTAIQVSELGGR